MDRHPTERDVLETPDFEVYRLGPTVPREFWEPEQTKEESED